MRFPDILPPSDLLKQVEGIESGLRQRQRLGFIGLFATLLQAVVLVANHEWFQTLLQRDWTSLFKAHWPSLLVLGGVIFTLLLSTWARFWIEESKEPFRYTYSIADFKPVLGPKAEGPQEDRLSVQMSHDLSERLNERIKRLALLDEGDSKNEPSKTDADTTPKPEIVKHKSHIHIRGYYVIRQKPDRQWFVEVMPRVRIGPLGSPEKLAHPVKFKLPTADGNGREPSVAKENENLAETVAPKTPEEMPPLMTPRQYEQILERVYFSVATEIYIQIQEDVKRKVDLLPTNYFRAVALFHEAEDYANSNTLDAYEAARKLYDQSLNYFDPDWKPLPKFFLWKLGQKLYRRLINLWSRLKRKATVVWPRFGRVEVMCARAEIGYANMLLYRRALARLSGQRVNASFDAPLVASKAVERVLGLSEGVKEREPSLFDAYVTLALAWFYLGSSRAAEKSLNKARALNPVSAEVNSRYLFVSGEVEPRMRSKLHLFRHAVDLDPRFEVAQFSLATQVETLWRTRPSLERNVAESVIKEYDEVLKLNPGNIGAWAKQGYIRWLLAAGQADVQKAREAFEDGREYKEIKRETFVAELDYGLARIAAEEGDFATAYSHYSSAVSAHLAQGIKYGGENVGWSYRIINENLLLRMVKFKDTVKGYFELWAEQDPHRRWQSRSFQQVVADLTQKEKKEAALRGIRALFNSVSARLSPADREQLKDLIGEGDLRSLAKQLKLPPTQELLRKLRSERLVDVIGRYLPTLRVRKSVYSFVLTQYGEACNYYYYRTGDLTWAMKARAALEEARDLNPQYIIPRYLLCQPVVSQLENREELLAELEQIVDIEPDWPDGILALAQARARLAKDKSRLAQDAMKKAENARVEVVDLEVKLGAEKNLDSGSSEAAETNQSQTIDDPRLPWQKKGPGTSARPPKLSARRQKLQSDIAAKKGIADSSEKDASEYKQAEKYLARGAVDGIRKLLPFKWAESALNEELEQSGREYRQTDRSDRLAERTGASQENAHFFSASVWARSIDDAAGKGIATLLENKEIEWERQMEDTHVRALKTWGEIRPFLSESRERRIKGRVVLRGEEILCHIRRHFWPDDFELHLTLRDLSKPVFGWEAAPAKDAQKLREFLVCLLGAKWLKSATIKRDLKDDSTIILAGNARTLTLRLDEERSRVCLIPGIEMNETDDGRFLCFRSEEPVNWDDIPGSDEKRFRALVRKSLGARWVRKAHIAKSEDDSAINLSDAEHSLSLKLDRLDSKPAVIMHEFKLEKTGSAEHEVRYLEYQQTSNEVICDAINRDWQGDRSSFFILNWVSDPSIEAKTRRSILTTVSSEDGLASSLYRWLGDQWFMESIAAIEEFKKTAAASEGFKKMAAASEESKKMAIEEFKANRALAESSLKMANDNIGWAVRVYNKAMDTSNGE
jgi:hypothetical protein